MLTIRYEVQHILTYSVSYTYVGIATAVSAAGTIKIQFHIHIHNIDYIYIYIYVYTYVILWRYIWLQCVTKYSLNTAGTTVLSTLSTALAASLRR